MQFNRATLYQLDEPQSDGFEMVEDDFAYEDLPTEEDLLLEEGVTEMIRLVDAETLIHYPRLVPPPAAPTIEVEDEPEPAVVSTSEVAQAFVQHDRAAVSHSGVQPGFLMRLMLAVRRWLLRSSCLLYTSDAADDMQCVGLGGCRIIKKKKR